MPMPKRRSALVVGLVVVLVAGSALPAAAAGEALLQGQADGRAAGARHPTYAWAWSAGWGFLAGLIGWAGALGYYATRSPEPDASQRFAIRQHGAEYELAYLEAYRQAARSKMLTQALVGGGIGTLLAAVAVSSRASLQESSPRVVLPLAAASW